MVRKKVLGFIIMRMESYLVKVSTRTVRKKVLGLSIMRMES
jgi:hypothetical protein